MNAPNEQAQVITVTTEHAMTLATVLRHVELVEHVLNKVMKKGTHYGESFPGDKKMNLLKPGADKLCLAFQLSPTFEIDERALIGEHREYRVTCKLTTASGRVMGEGVGTCSTMEKKYRWRNAKAKCPECQKETVIKTQRGYWCPPDKGGCGCNPSAPAIENQVRGQVENTDIADVFNTCLKIGKKRAYVDATITATAASDLFTQDIEDLQATAEVEERKEATKQAAAHPQEERREAPKGPASAGVSSAPTPGSSTPGQQPPPRSASVQQPPSAATGSSPTGLRDASADVAAAKAHQTGPTKQDCEKVYHGVVKLIGDKTAKVVWRHFGADHTKRLDGLTKVERSAQAILKIVGADRGEQIVADCVDHHGNDQMADVQAFIDELGRLSEGEVIERKAVAKAAAGIDSDEPPF